MLRTVQPRALVAARPRRRGALDESTTLTRASRSPYSSVQALPDVQEKSSVPLAKSCSYTALLK